MFCGDKLSLTICLAECIIFNVEFCHEKEDDYIFMIDFRPVSFKDKELYESYLTDIESRGCELTFANLCFWGQQNMAVVDGHIVLFSHFGDLTIYPYPIGKGDKRSVLDKIIEDAAERGIECIISSLDEEAKHTLETYYPDKFRYFFDPASYDYVYSIDDLADLKGRKYQKKRNHLNRFRQTYPDHKVVPIDGTNISELKKMVDLWYEEKAAKGTDEDYELEKAAIEKAFEGYSELGLEGLVILNEGKVLALTLGSRMSADTFDVHFEKARSDADGAYAAINREFASYIREKYPDVRYLDREEDMGIEGLRKSKESYYPHHMIAEYWAREATPSE